MKKLSQPSRRDAAKSRHDPSRAEKERSGLYGSQAPKPGARNPSGDTVVQAKPAGTKLHGDKLSQPGYLEAAAERETHQSLRRGATSGQNRFASARPQRRRTP